MNTQEIKTALRNVSDAAEFQQLVAIIEQLKEIGSDIRNGVGIRFYENFFIGYNDNCAFAVTYADPHTMSVYCPSIR
jgi:hypothetical protein